MSQPPSKYLLAAMSLLLSAELASAQQAPAAAEAAAPSQSQPSATIATVTLSANAAVPLRFVTTVSSGTHTRGQQFDLEVTDDINVDGVVVVPAGSIAVGEVVHADRARGLGKAGELILAARYVTVGDRRIKLRSQLSMTGQDKSMQALYLVPWIKGKNLEVPAETEVIARTVVDEKFANTSPKPTN